MPNWATCTISFAGPAEGVAVIRDSLTPARSNPSELRFDFNQLLPTPPELENVTSPLRVMATQEEADEVNGDSDRVWAVTRATAERFLADFGAVDWQAWRLANWGTKWTGSYAEVLLDSPDELIVRFDTAWTEPGQLLQAMSQKHGLTVTGGVIYEDGSEFAPVACFPDDADTSDPQELFEQAFVVREETEQDPDEPEFTWVNRWIELAS
ncbi:UNVERIFIED_ORG: hypothetical protein EDC92_1199 [Dietzia maris]|uniref:DUF1281 family ferredoxin-like fold protein n=1 Tax=Dietzia maris TaxID=37915 RepID=UPI00104F2BF5